LDDVLWREGLLTEFSPTSVNGDRRILNISVQHLLEHSSGWNQRVTGDISGLLRPHTDTRQRQAASKDDIIVYMMNQTLQYKPGKSH